MTHGPAVHGPGGPAVRPYHGRGRGLYAKTPRETSDGRVGAKRLYVTPSRHAPSLQPIPRITPSRLNPALSSVFCSAMFSTSVSASMRWTGECANR